MASSTAKPTVDHHHLYTETIRILHTNSGHFLALSLLFLPLTVAAAALFQSHFSSVPASDYLTAITTLFPIKTLITSPQTLFSIKTLILILAFILFVLPGVAMITYSANQAIYHKPLTFSSTVKSLSYSYIPLLSTAMAASIKLTSVSILFTLSAIGITELVKLSGLHFDHFDYSIFINTISFYALLITVILFVGIWGLSAAITVVESKLGFETLRQSASRLSEFRSVFFSIANSQGFVFVTFMMLNSTVVPKIGAAMRLIWILQVFAICLDVSMLFSYLVVLNTVLYVQCKVLSGEEIVEAAVETEVSGEYVSLVADEEDGKVKSQRSTAEANGCFVYLMFFLGIVGFCMGTYIIK